MSLRVISGTARGRKLKSVPSDTTRPVMDRVKEALFNILAGDVLNSNWWDLFGGTGAIGIDIDLSPSRVQVALTEPDANRFDVTRVPPVDTTLPIEQRQPGGLGLHLARRLVDTLEYDYAPDERRSRITFTIGTPPATAARTEQVRDAGH